jgi:peptide/nickel transport system substrate-binding protein
MSYLPNGRLLALSVAVGALVVLALAACALNPLPPPPTPTATLAPPTPTPLPRGGNLTIRLAADIPELRPWHARSRGEEQVIGMLYSGLLRLDARLQPQPDLAEAWRASDDGRVITFTLRANLSWHDDRPLTAEDVTYTIDALHEISPTTALLIELRRIEDVEALDERTVVMRLSERHAPIFSALTVPILPRHLLIGRDIATLNFWDVPVGSGAFQFGERIPNASITLEANQLFHRGAPLLDRVAFVVAPDPAVAAAALADGRLLLAELPWGNGAAQADLQRGLYPENGYYFLAFNQRPGRIFADERLRRALALAVDLPALVEDVTGGQGVVIGNSAAPGSWADATPPPTSTLNLDRARLLLDEAGWKVPEGGEIRQQGERALSAAIYVRGDDTRRVRAAELLAEAGRSIGMELTVERADFATTIRALAAPPYDFDLLLASWVNGIGDPTFGDYAYYDPDDFQLFHSSQVNQGVADDRVTLNLGGFADPAYDNQSVAARQLYEPEDRLRAIGLAQERVAAQVPYLFLWADRAPVALSPQVTTLDGPVNLDSPLYLWNVERWYLRGGS